ncbi:PREDICTED: uncharacterized protein LOC106808180 [Priapulus caudatus]|uniref:Uncharacterized protein LOC106808180 n=1 Tax=Priapulus caudatus TaxID=37621 RepID=A0ABM1E243_PRICU|nr:PREDICTED: uncharacterized protein LOC106808180 [Priapulus caudatus]
MLVKRLNSIVAKHTGLQSPQSNGSLTSHGSGLVFPRILSTQDGRGSLLSLRPSVNWEKKDSPSSRDRRGSLTSRLPSVNGERNGSLASIYKTALFISSKPSINGEMKVPFPSTGKRGSLPLQSPSLDGERRGSFLPTDRKGSLQSQPPSLAAERSGSFLSTDRRGSLTSKQIFGGGERRGSLGSMSRRGSISKHATARDKRGCTSKRGSVTGGRRPGPDAQSLQEIYDIISEINRRLVAGPASNRKLPLIGNDADFRAKVQAQLTTLTAILQRLKEQSPGPWADGINPKELLDCTYLRLSDNNVERLEKMCEDAGMLVGIHPHSAIPDVAAAVFDSEP